MIDFAQVLNPEQCAAATAGDGPLLVLAAAGTGKTRTLVHRVAFLVEKGIPAERVLLLTFTNRAAREMLERAEQLVPNLQGIWSGTFHSVCARLLRRWGTKLGFRSDFQILDEDDQTKLMKQCIKDLVKSPKDFQKPSMLLKLISDAANRERDLEQLVASYQTKTAIDVDEVMKVLRAYIARKNELGAMDFDDLLVNGLRLLRECDDVRALLQDHFLHVLVDEYQDTNTLQAAFTDILAAKTRNLMVVGDDFQCIYTWRGAQFENIMEFPNRWPGCRIVKLERNYRSLAPILDVANCVMKDVPHQFEKTLRPFRAAGGIKPQYYGMWDSNGQSELIVKLVRHLHTNTGVAWRDIAILYRSHFSSIDIQMALTRAGAPFRITSGVGVFEQLHVKDVLAFLRLVVDPRAELSFLRLLSLLPGVGETTARKCWQRLGGSFDGTNAMERMNLESFLSPKAVPAWQAIAQAFAAAPAHLAAGADRLVIEDFVRLFYGDHLNRQFEPEDADSRRDDLNELISHVASTDGGLKAFLAEVALLTNLDRKTHDREADAMLLSTVHQSKGMEWPVVILPWLVEGIFPSQRSLEDKNIDEERRLFYVAVTRAKDRLYLCVPKSRKSSEGGSYPVEPSTFVREIPMELYDAHEVRSYEADSGYGGVGGAYRRARPSAGSGGGDVYGGWGSRYGRGGGGGSSGTSGWKTTWRK